jgi:hypothetical protein
LTEKVVGRAGERGGLPSFVANWRALLLRLLELDFWVLWLERYYPDLFGKAEVTEELAARGLGVRGSFAIESDLWEELVEGGIRDRLLCSEVGGTRLRPLDPHTKVMVQALVRDGFLFKDTTGLGPNSTAFVIPKSAVKCSLIADLRPVNEHTPRPLPKFSLPSMDSLADIWLRRGHLGWWGVTLDLTNCYWSLLIPEEWWGCFRVDGYTYHTLPFGWNLSPVIAQRTLQRLVDRFLVGVGALLHLGASLLTWVYLDDVFILGQDREWVAHLGQALSNFLTEQGFCVSVKSMLTPSQRVLWLGKEFDLVKGQIVNKQGLQLRLIGLSLMASVSKLNHKRVESLLGVLNWAYRPLPGYSLFAWSWYAFLYAGRVGLLATDGMVSALLDALAIAFRGWEPPEIFVPPLLGPTVAVDSARVGDTYRVGFFSPLWGVRQAVLKGPIFSQQQAELFGVLHVVEIAVKLGFRSLTLLVDNLATIHVLLAFKPFRGVRETLLRVRDIFNWLWDHHMILHIFWCPTILQPADPASRVEGWDREGVSRVLERTNQLWYYAFQNMAALKFMGTVHL